jgi:hypothetical protein
LANDGVTNDAINLAGLRPPPFRAKDPKHMAPIRRGGGGPVLPDLVFGVAAAPGVDTGGGIHALAKDMAIQCRRADHSPKETGRSGDMPETSAPYGSEAPVAPPA